ncbi:hypothetical protein MRS44_004998 [Fusarium solani]|uniref:uncharacterized protein n=1 Tax=Fusarium solani TaxID=169388 RepID=UPI0032C3D680|nr:hypothetical protein MRS44_004998 [Fusarium solani]
MGQPSSANPPAPGFHLTAARPSRPSGCGLKTSAMCVPGGINPSQAGHGQLVRRGAGTVRCGRCSGGMLDSAIVIRHEAAEPSLTFQVAMGPGWMPMDGWTDGASYAIVQAPTTLGPS